MKQVDVTIRDPLDSEKKSWDKMALHPLQSWAWGDFRKSMGVDVVRKVVIKNNAIVQPWLLTFHKIPHFPFTIGYFPKGPSPTDAMLNELIRIGKQKNAVFIQLEPNVRLDSKLNPPAGGQISNLKPSHHPLFTRFTFILDLTKTEDELLKAMHPKTRYNIRVAQKHDVIIKEDNSPSAFEEYLRLSQETTQRQGFFAHNERYHRTMWQILHKAGLAHLWTASYSGKTLAVWILFTWNDTVYYPYGASSREHKEVMAPNLLLWEIIRWAKKKGFTSFDLWGALGPDPDTNDPWYGFHRFKQGFHPNLVEYIGSYDLVINPYLYQVYKIADIIRWKLLKRKYHS